MRSVEFYRAMSFEITTTRLRGEMCIKTAQSVYVLGGFGLY